MTEEASTEPSLDSQHGSAEWCISIYLVTLSEHVGWKEAEGVKNQTFPGKDTLRRQLTGSQGSPAGKNASVGRSK